MTRAPLGAALALGLALAGPAVAQSPPPGVEEALDTLLTALLGVREVTPAELQKDVEEAGGLPFRREVPLDYMTRRDLEAYLAEVFDAEYPEARARADERTFIAFGMLPPGTDLRKLRARLLRENIAGFYDERPGRKRLYAVSAERRLTPSNQVVLAHELRHALQDQYVDVHALFPGDAGDFDDRRLAVLAVLEGDATLVMERFLLNRLGPAAAVPPVGSPLDGAALSLPGTPRILSDQLLQPYLVGRAFAARLLADGGWEAVRAAWEKPPRSTEQVLHPERFTAREEPLSVALPPPARGARTVAEGVLGELLVRTFLDGEPAERVHAAAAGWGGDAYRVEETGGATLLTWRSVWDTEDDAREFAQAAEARLGRVHRASGRRGMFRMFERGPWHVALRRLERVVDFVSSDRRGSLQSALDRIDAAPRPWQPVPGRGAASGQE